MGSNQKKPLELPGARQGYIQSLNSEQNVSLNTKYSRFLNSANQTAIKYKPDEPKEEIVTSSQSDEIETVNIYERFNSLIQIFAFAPPSDNIWDIKIELSDQQDSTGAYNTGDRSLSELYYNIKKVNETWNNNRAFTTWAINIPENLENAESYITSLSKEQLGIFLAQNVNFTPFSINYDGAAFGELQQHGSFYKNAKVVKSRKDDDTLKISFLVSNWDIGDILIEPWMAAIAQHGLIEHGDICIKAKIIITEYSASRPKKDSEEKYGTRMEARKQYIFNNCFPISRDEIKKSYDQTEAGTYKTQVVTFVYDSYRLNYKF